MSFNLADYEPVEDRLRRFWADHPAGRITTTLLTTPGAETIVFRAEAWRGDAMESDPMSRMPDATGHAQETVTARGVNSTSALENGETSAIGRALANLGYAPKGARPSREEMTKANVRVMSDEAFDAAVLTIDDLTDADALRALWVEATRRQLTEVVAEIAARGEAVKAA